MMEIAYDDFSQLFPLANDIVGVEPISAILMPEVYGRLLNHTHHMTVTVEKHFQSRVDVNVEEWDQDDIWYYRKITLSLQKSERIVQFGIVKIRLEVLTPTVRGLILGHSIPLGRILIENNVLTTVNPVQFLKVSLGPELCDQFGCPYPATSFGRIGLITADGQPAIEVLEVLTTKV